MRSSTSGFILVSALAVLAILAALAGGVAFLARSALGEAAAARDALARDALTHAGLELAAYQMYMLKRPPAEVAEQRVRLDGGTVTLSVFPESGRVDLNGADPALLAGIWRVVGSGDLTPETFAARVADWRDADDARGRGGAERDDYEAAGVKRAPANAPFESVDDLQHVLGVTATRVRALKPFLTVRNPSGRVDLKEAPREVLLAVPGLDGRKIGRILRLRRAGGPAAAEEIAALGGQGEEGDRAKAGAGRAFEVRLLSETRAGGRRATFDILRALDDSSLYLVTGYSDDF